MLTSNLLSKAPYVRHGFLTRSGGVSEGVYASLNCGFGSGDAPLCVTANRQAVIKQLGFPDAVLVTAQQVHSANVCVVEKPWDSDGAPKVDGLVTRHEGIALGILTADCVPILFADANAGVIGAAHAGWRGAKDGVIEATVQAMITQGAMAENISAAIGPCIRQESYEVGPEFLDAFLVDDASDIRFFVTLEGSDRAHFDLPGYVQKRLNACGVCHVDDINADTCADEARFFSYRRSVLNGETDFGRGISVIMLEPSR